jgi:hypothetical protein
MAVGTLRRHVSMKRSRASVYSNPRLSLKASVVAGSVLLDTNGRGSRGKSCASPPLIGGVARGGVWVKNRETEVRVRASRIQGVGGGGEVM